MKKKYAISLEQDMAMAQEKNPWLDIPNVTPTPFCLGVGRSMNHFSLAPDRAEFETLAEARLMIQNIMNPFYSIDHGSNSWTGSTSPYLGLIYCLLSGQTKDNKDASLRAYNGRGTLAIIEFDEGNYDRNLDSTRIVEEYAVAASMSTSLEPIKRLSL